MFRPAAVVLVKKEVHRGGPRVLRETNREGKTSIIVSLHKLCKVLTEHLT